MLRLGSFGYNIMHMKMHVTINKGFITLSDQGISRLVLKELTREIFYHSGMSYRNLFIGANVLIET